MTRDDGLWIFVAVVAGDVIGLLFDLLLMKSGLPMVTDVAKRNLPLAIAIVGLQCLLVAGLAYHFWSPNGK